MKKEIMSLIKSKEEERFRLNNICYLRHWTQNALGDNCDMLVLEFDNINGVSFGQWQVIRSRAYEGIIQECKEAISYHLGGVIGRLCKDLDAGYRNKEK